MRKFIIGGLAITGGLCLTSVATSYVLTRYKKEIRDYVLEKVIDYFFTDENGEDIDDSELIMAAINTYMKRKGDK